MFLKELTLKGFKSFAEPTTLEFAPGVTVVVGPNGSGKSNIVDAVGWVLGAQAPSVVRSQKMDDVIFAGTSNRPALGRAEVSLTIDNGAGLLPIEFSEVTITRTLFRTGESEYAVNGVPCRLLDIQELLSDTGVGRQQHVIVSQGQIDAVLNARPEERRAVIEEAAGILKFRKRKERSERRLAATETNLTRLQDLLREVRRQRRPLERQAEAARRHGDLVAELAELRVFLAGRELAALRGRKSTNERKRAELKSDEGATKASLAQLDSAVLTAETQLSAIGADDLGEVLARFESVRERAKGLAAVLEERRRRIAREREAVVDASVIALLEAEAAEVTDELHAVTADDASLATSADELAVAEQALAAKRAACDAEWADADNNNSATPNEAAERRGELAALRDAAARTTTELERVQQRVDALAHDVARLTDDTSRLRQEHDALDEAGRPLAHARAEAATNRTSAEHTLEAARDELRSVESERSTWAARAEALAHALDQARARAGAAALDEVGGVVGTLLDLVDVDEGYEAAFETAVDEALAAVVVDSTATARQALDALQRDGGRGAVLPLDVHRVSTNGFKPPVGHALRHHVRARTGLGPVTEGTDRLLDVLVGSVVVVDGGWQSAVDAALAANGATSYKTVVVTRNGDRFGPTGWRVGIWGAGATGAALDEARQRLAELERSVEAASDAMHDARRAHDEARQADVETSRQCDAHDRRVAAATEALTKLEGELRRVITERDALVSHRDELRQRIERDESRIGELDEALPALEADEARQLEAARAKEAARRVLDEKAEGLRTRRTELEVRQSALGQRRQLCQRRLTEIDTRLANHVAERQEAADRRLDLERQARACDRLAAVVADRIEVLERGVVVVQERRGEHAEQARSVSSRLDGLRRQRAADERTLEEVRERLRRAELEGAELDVRLEQATEHVRSELDCEPDTAMAASCPPLPDGTSPQSRVRELERELRLMGPVNPLAVEEYEALRERHEFLESQLDDVKQSRRELAKVIRAIDEEIVSVFAAAFADAANHFEKLFATLFPGGRGRLTLTDSTNLLDCGVEVEARPAGKNVRKLSLLSGGERSLVALAFSFAVFRSRPSPFYVMDEVEAALDDVNLHRFLDLVHEFGAESQLVIVSHQKRTMEAADCLYGVSLQPGGSSKVVSERLTKTSKLA